MKNVISTLLGGMLVLLGTQAFAQSPRMVLVEEATQASCPPCASANPGLQTLLNANHDKAIFIAYQVWWPGYDAMYLDNEQGVRDRIDDYYPDVTGAPNIVVQGNSGAQSVSFLSQSSIDAGNAEMSPWTMTVEGDVAASFDSNGDIDTAVLTISGMAISSDTIIQDSVNSGSMRMRLVLTEEVIYNEDLVQIGTNGETEFHHVFKEWIGGHAGDAVADTIMPGDTIMINETLDLTTLNIYHYGGLEVIAMIQTDYDKYIHQAVKTSHIGVSVGVATTAGVTGATEIEGLCPGDSFTPEVTIANSGDNDLTSATITYNLNGGADQTFNWTGSLTTLGTEKVTLATMTLDAPQATNTLNVTVSAPNGTTDDLMADNNITADVPVAKEATEYLKLEFTTDNYGNELYWEVQDGSGTMVASGGNAAVGLTNIDNGTGAPPADPGAYGNQETVLEWIDVSALDCHTFFFADYWGDGILSADQSYTLTDSNGDVIVSGDFGNDLTTNKYIGGAIGTSVNDVVAQNDFTVTTNPIVDRLDVRINLLEGANASISMMDASGRVVMTEQLGRMSAGEYVNSYELTDLPAGMYFVSFVSNENVINKKVVVSK